MNRLLVVATASLGVARGLAAPARLTLGVCTSPGCLTDGAAECLAKLRCLAVPSTGIVAQSGGCTSKCGAGPVVRIDRSADGQATVAETVQETRVLDDASVVALFARLGADPPSESLLRAWALLQEGNDTANSAAVRGAKYREAIEAGRPAVLAAAPRVAPAEAADKRTRWRDTAWTESYGGSTLAFEGGWPQAWAGLVAVYGNGRGIIRDCVVSDDGRTLTGRWVEPGDGGT